MQELDMRWFTDQFARRRLHDQIMDCSKAALPFVLERLPKDTEIDAIHAAKVSVDIGTALATEFLERGLI